MQSSNLDLFTKSKWNYRSPSVDRNSAENALNNANNWQGQHMYRTSYNDMYTKVSSH